MSVIKIVYGSGKEPSKQSTQGERLNKGNRPSVKDTLDAHRNNVNNIPLKRTERGSIRDKDNDSAPLDKMTGKSNTLIKAAKGVGAVALVNRAVNIATSNVGLFYNDSAKQNMASNVMEVVSTGSSILGAAAAGSVFGPVGTAIGAAIGLANEALNLAVESVKLSRDMQNKFQQSERDSSRLGVIVSTRR